MFTHGMRRYTDSTVSSFLDGVAFDQTAGFLNKWNEGRSRGEKIYISYDSTNKNCQAGDLEIVEFGKAKDDARIQAARNAVAKAKARHEKAVDALKSLLNRRDEMRKRELMQAIADSDRTYEESLRFIKS